MGVVSRSKMNLLGTLEGQKEKCSYAFLINRTFLLKSNFWSFFFIELTQKQITVDDF